MDEIERSTHIRTEEVIPAEPVVPVVPVVSAPVYAATPVAPVYAAQPVVQQPVYAAQPVVAQPMVSNRVVTEHEYVRTGPNALEMTRRIVGLVFGILQALIAIRIVLLLLIANRENDIVQFVLNVTGPFVNPFRDMFALSKITASGSVLDVAAIVALFAWTLVELLIFAIIRLGAPRRTVGG